MTLIARFGTTLLLAATLVCAPATAHAQSVPPALTTLPPLVGRQVKIVYRDGRVMYSEVKQQDATTITVGGMPPDGLSDILSIDVADRAVDGGIKGALVGVALGLAATKGHSKVVPIAAAALGWVLGVAVDLAHPDYERVLQNQPPQLTVLPAATRHSIGFSGTVRW